MMAKAKAKRDFAKGEYMIILGLLLLSLFPIFAGLVRLYQLATENIANEDLRFQASPAPVVIHIVSVTIYSVLGAFQFSPNLRRRFANLHRRNGKLLIISGILVALSGLWMTVFYPPANFDGVFIYYVRVVIGLGMLFSIAMGIQAIRARDFFEHGNWMIRAYALGLGAGTQVLTHIPWFLFPSIQGEFSRATFMTAGWVINLGVAEWIIKTSKIRSEVLNESI